MSSPSVCLLIDFASLGCLRDWISAGIAEGWLPAGATLYHLAGAPDTFVVREGPAPRLTPLPVASCDKTFGTTVVRSNLDPDALEE